MTDPEFQKFIIKHLTELSAEVKQIRQTQVKMELENSEKFSALFDGYESIKGTLTDHTDRLQRIEDKLETHEIQIKVLDSTKANKRKANQ